MESQGSSPTGPEVRDHRRQWRRCLYVYPVISRRSKGLSIGVNLNQIAKVANASGTVPPGLLPLMARLNSFLDRYMYGDGED